MTIVLLTLAVVCALSGAAVLALFAHSACTHALEPELLVIDDPLPGTAPVEIEEALELHAAGEPA
jgi:hypothetical protein